jgi:hypothetical protein
MNDALFTDVDQDGIADLVTASPYDQAVYVYRGMGEDRYLRGEALLSDITAARSLAVADMDNDGVKDLVVAGGAQNGLLVARNNGSGVYDAAPVNSTLQEPAYVRVADINADGAIDLVAASPSDDRLELYLGTGTGDFSTGIVISSTADGVNRFDLGDVDNDGDLDVLAQHPGSQTIVWHAYLGNGTFGPANIIAASLPGLMTSMLADLNGDGVKDVLVAYGSDDLVWYPGVGDGTFSAVVPIAVINSLRGAWAADMDQDGDLDVLTGHFGTSRLYLNNGQGSFAQHTPAVSFGGDVAMLEDINGDGRVDLCYRRNSSQDVVYYLNLGGLTFGPRITVPRYYEAFGLDVLDVDGDSDLDLITTQGTFRPVTLFTQVAPGTFLPGQELFFEGDEVTNFTLHDLDQDGAQDVLFLHGGSVIRDLYWMRNIAGVFGPAELLQEQYLPDNYRIELADVDGDGDLDHLVSSPHVGWRRNDNGVFSAHITVDASITRGPVVQADINGDGLPDLVAANFDSFVARWYRNSGNATFTTQPNLPTFVDNAVQIHPADLDGDNDIDLVINGGFNEMNVVLNTGSGSFSAPQDLNTTNVTTMMHLHDVDSDGDLDIMNGNYTQFRWLPNNGLGQFGALTPLLPDEPYSTALNSSVLVDIDNDGLLDVVYAENEEPRLVWLNNRFNSYYRIQGRLYWDADQDGVRDAGEMPAPWATVVAEPAPNFPFSANNGTYQALVSEGTFTVRPVFDTTLWRITSDSLQYTVLLSEDAPISANNDFGLFVNNANSVVDLGFVPPDGVCDDVVQHWISMTNLGNFTESGILALEMDTLFTLVSATPQPDSTVNHVHFWSYSGLGFYNSFSIALQTQRPDFTAIGDSIHFGLVAYSFDPQLPGSIVDTLRLAWDGIVTCSYDPNDKRSDPEGFGLFGAVDISTDHLDYTIRYQNTGNAPAVNVVLRDTLPAQADLSRLTLLAYSFAPTDLRVDSGGVLTVRLQGILLPDSASDPLGSQGFVRFRMGVQPGLSHLTEITNTAGIYFDLNPPIITNTTLNTLVDCALWDPQIMPLGFDSLTCTPGLRYRWTLNEEALPNSDQQAIPATLNGTYRVEVTSVYGCVAQAEFVLLTTATSGADTPRMGLLPNPAEDHVTLRADRPIGPDHRIVLSDAQGRAVREWVGNGSAQHMLYVDGLQRGVYLLTIAHVDGERWSTRLVIQ